MMVADPLPIVLWLAIEDYSGLWEIVWELNTRSPEDRASNGRRARETVRELLQRGFLDLYWTDEPYGDPVRIPAPEIDAVLDTDEYWDAPTAGVRSVRIGATEAGEEGYELLAKRDTT
jgi:hypothetical protein